jgi:hypothetical protein
VELKYSATAATPIVPTHGNYRLNADGVNRSVRATAHHKLTQFLVSDTNEAHLCGLRKPFFAKLRRRDDYCSRVAVYSDGRGQHVRQDRSRLAEPRAWARLLIVANSGVLRIGNLRTGYCGIRLARSRNAAMCSGFNATTSLHTFHSTDVALDTRTKVSMSTSIWKVSATPPRYGTMFPL